jgi:hypothetical protein
MRELAKKEVKFLLREFEDKTHSAESWALQYVGRKSTDALRASNELAYAKAQLDLLKTLLENYHVKLFTDLSEEDFSNEHYVEDD